MAFVPLPETARLCIKFSIAGGTAFICFYFTRAGGFGTGQLQTLADDGAAWVDVSVMPFLGTTVVATEAIATDMRTASGPQRSSTVGLPQGGTILATLPGNVAECVSLLTNLRGRSYRGRVYFPPTGEAEVTLDTISATVVTGLVTAVATLQGSQLTNRQNTMVVASRFENGLPRVTGVLTPVTIIRADNVVDSQRRRLSGRGA